MRNLKRVLSLALALVMVLGMMVITTSAADFTDADEITYTEAMDVMAALGVFKGDDNGNVNPDDVLTRKEAAVLVARIILGDKLVEDLAPTTQIFEDVPLTAATEWYAAEVEYCNNIGMIVGHNGKFDPDGQLTGTAFAKLILCAMGYDAAAQGYIGDKWDTNINADAIRNGLNIKGVNINAPLTREGAAQMLFQALDGEMVKYDTYYDYATGAAVLAGPFEVKDKTFADYFGDLEKFEGVVNAVDYYYGDIELFNNDKFVTGEKFIDIRDAGADYNNIGYAGYVWAVPTTAEGKTVWTAVSDLFITGTSLGKSTNGTSMDSLTYKYGYDFLAEVDAKDYNSCSVYYNGEHVGYYANAMLDKTETYYDADAAAALAAVGKIGVKVDFVDNDNEGKAEAIVINEYTFAQVDRVVKQSKSGVVSTKYYLMSNGEKIEPEQLVGATELAKGDFVTYIAYADDYYDYYDYSEYKYYLTNVLDVAEGEFESITRTKLWGDSNAYTRVYNIDGEGYVKSNLSTAADKFLVTANVNEDVEYVLDQYGYIVYADAPAADPYSYVLVLDNEDSHGIKDIAETELVYVDGTVDIVNVDCEDDVEDGKLAENGPVYTYEVKNGAYVLDDAVFAKLENVTYKTYEVTMSDSDLTIDLTATTVVDLRDVLAGKAENGKLYVGYTEIPTFSEGLLYYIPEIDVAFLVAGKAPAAGADKSASFVVFNTETNIVDQVKVGTTYVNTYELVAGVLVKGELVTNYVLSQTQKNDIDTYGVGAYTWDKTGALVDYTSFAEYTVEWTPEDNGTVIIDNVDVTAAGTFDDIIVLDISAGEVGEWWQLVEAGDYYAYVAGKVLYIVGDDVASYTYKVNDATVNYTSDILAVAGKKDYWGDPIGYTVVENMEFLKKYISMEGHVTAVEKLEAPEVIPTYTVTLVDLIEGLNITADKTTDLKKGDVVTLTVAADAGYLMDQAYYVTVNNVLLDAAANHKYTVTIAGNTTVELDGASTLTNCVVNSVDGVADTATLTPETGSKWVMPYGSTYSFKVAADAGFVIKSVKANDTALTADANGVYSFVVTANTVIYVETEAQEFTVTFEYYMDNNLIVANTQKTTIKAGAEKDVILGTDDAYSYVVDGVIYAAKAPYTLTGITKDTTVKVYVYADGTVAVATTADVATVIANAKAGDTIYLGDGEYELQGATAKSLTIIGNGETVIADNAANSEAGNVLRGMLVNSGDLVVKGVVFDGGVNGICFGGSGSITVEDCTFKNITGAAIYLAEGAGINGGAITNCVFESTCYRSVAIPAGSLDAELVVSGCTFDCGEIDNGTYPAN